MGYSLSWAALKGGDRETVCSALGLRATGKHQGIAESKIDGAALPTGWYVVVFDRTEIKDKTLEKLSQAGEVVSCFVEEHVMFSSAASWRNGKQMWRVAHDGGDDKGRFHLDAMGDLPVAFQRIRKELFDKQEAEGGEEADVDHVFDIPVELAKQLVGFRHDEDITGMSGDVFEVLEPAQGARVKKSLGNFLGGLFKGGTGE